MIDLRCGDALETLRTLPAASVQCVVTSPPYWGLRDYGVNGQMGLEATPAEYVRRMVNLFREVRRVLKPDGTLWLNLGDSYITSPGNGRGGEGERATLSHGGKPPHRSGMARRFRPSGTPGNAAGNRDGVRGGGLPSKSLAGIPWRVALALQDDGWILRSDVIWEKPDAMPEPVKDRPTKSHEYVFLMTRSARYYYDGASVREPAVDARWRAEGAPPRAGSPLLRGPRRGTVSQGPVAPDGAVRMAECPHRLADPETGIPRRPLRGLPAGARPPRDPRRLPARRRRDGPVRRLRDDRSRRRRAGAIVRRHRPEPGLSRYGPRRIAAAAPAVAV